MSGKAALFLVLGFGLIFAYFIHNVNSYSTDSVENMVDYYNETYSHNLAVSGANMALNRIFINDTWDTGYDHLDFSGGDIHVVVSDTIGENVYIFSYGTYNGTSSLVRVKLKPSSYAKFAWFIGNMSSKVFVTGDTVWGPFHTQSELNIGGDPVFWGKVTTLKGMSPSEKKLKKNGYEPKFYGGYDSGVDIPLPSNYQFDEQYDAAMDGVTNKGGSSLFSDTDVHLEFNGDGTVTYRTGTGKDTSGYGPPTTVDVDDFAPNGIMYVEKGDIYVQGVVDHQITLVAGESSGSGHGNVHIMDDLVYSSDPMVWDSDEETYVPNYNSSEMLGILATNNLYIANTPANVENKDVRIDAAIFCSQGGVKMEDPTIPPSGQLYLRGGVVAAKEEEIAEVDGDGNVTNGYERYVIFDQRFMLNIPPNFPKTGEFEIVSWYE
jgi:hypothetical protein